MSDASSSKSGFLITLAAVIGGFAIFVLILVIAYLPRQAAPLPEGTLTPAERSARLADMRAKEHDASTTYGWVDQANGVVRLPISRAMELTVQELNAKR